MPAGFPHRVRAPGRVNLIGEHVDYNDLPVLPMALPRAVEIRFRPRDDATVVLESRDPDFGPVRFEVGEEIEPGDAGSWGNYARAAVRAVARRAGRPLQGLDGVVDSDLPVAAGLSSSSALVVAVAKALLARNDLEVPGLELAGLLARGERYVGTAGGGMDQAASLLGRPGHALRVDFAPLAVEPIPVPEGWCFVVASSLVPAEKSGRAQEAYNARTRACAEALAAVAAAVRPDDPPASYRELLDAAPRQRLLDAARPALDGTTFRRFRHVVTESARVEEAVEALRSDDRETFGDLMTASHGSLRDDYEVSTPELDELVEIALGAGADGARLTGAGFGGSALVLASRSVKHRVMRALRAGFYEPRGVRAGSLPDVLFGLGVRPPAG